jgi:hypothetical protein
MSKGLLFWILMVLWLIFGSYVGYAGGVTWVHVGSNLIPWLCVALLGWHNFGFIVQ